ncbi:MAG TPA: hypothetical protein P5243_06800 [Bacteroidales bacterium]|jgi:hypothetical protein|nr:hypothetical protein [Bacteroidales bacterium]HRS19193.1 hypothetical protein [Bacteroidales bacterium]
MKTYLLSVLLCIVASVTVYSQDIIILKTGDEIQSKVEEIRPDVVTYRKFENLQGPLYTIEKSRIFMIKYANGSKDVFSDITVQQQQQIQQSNAIPKPTQPAITEANKEEPLQYIFGGTIRRNNTNLTPFKVKEIMRSNPEAFSLYSSGRSLKVTGDVFEGIGYGCFVFMVINSLDNKEIQARRAAGFGIATMSTSLILEAIGKSNMRKAVNTYNAGLKSTSYLFLSPNSMGYCLRF